ncbi:hypothetical protein NFI96_012041 [Prochilodus magdalenae]|nr:hypothetical protein NFI96_012041 [Prochilodus magdalenae]
MLCVNLTPCATLLSLFRPPNQSHTSETGAFPLALAAVVVAEVEEVVPREWANNPLVRLQAVPLKVLHTELATHKSSLPACTRSSGHTTGVTEALDKREPV